MGFKANLDDIFFSQSQVRPSPAAPPPSAIIQLTNHSPPPPPSDTAIALRDCNNDVDRAFDVQLEKSLAADTGDGFETKKKKTKSKDAKPANGATFKNRSEFLMGVVSDAVVSDVVHGVLDLFCLRR